MTNIGSDIEQLEQLVDAPNARQMLTTYLLTDPSTDAGRNLHAQFTYLAHTVRRGLTPAERATLDQSLAKTEDAIGSVATPPRSLAIFASTQPDFLRVIEIPTRLSPLAFWGTGPYLRPLRAALDEQQTTFVMLLDKERTRIFRLVLDEIEEIEQFEDYVPGKHRQMGGTPARGAWTPGGWADSSIERDHERHVQQHVRLAIDAVRAYLRRETARVIVAGPPEVRSLVNALAPKPLRDRIVDELQIPLIATPGEVRQAAVSAIAAAERRGESELMNEMAEKEGRGQAIFGARSVVGAIVDGQAALLVYVYGAEVSGRACPRCGNLTVSGGGQPKEHCDRCGGMTEVVPDLVDVLSHRLLSQGGRVEEVRGAAAEQLSARGGLGAVLRYRTPVVVG